MQFLYHIYRGYCSRASRDWPRAWALRVEIPLGFIAIGLVYGLVSYGITSDIHPHEISTGDRITPTSTQELVVDWLLTLALIVAGAGLIVWITAVIRSLPLLSAPRLRYHPDAGLLTLFALSFLAFPLLTRCAIAMNFKLGWGSLMFSPTDYRHGSKEYIDSPLSMIPLVIYCGVASLVANFGMIARLDGIWRALGSAFILLVYGVLFTIIAFTISHQPDKAFHYAAGILFVMVVTQFTLALVNFGRRLRLLLFYPALLACNIGLMTLFYGQVADREEWDGIFSSNINDNFVPLVFVITLSIVLCSMQSIVIRQQIRQPWN